MPIPNAIRNRHCAKLTAIGEKKAATESIPLLFQYLYSPYAHPFFHVAALQRWSYLLIIASPERMKESLWSRQKKSEWQKCEAIRTIQIGFRT